MVNYVIEMIGMIVMMAIIIIAVVYYVLLPSISVQSSSDFYSSFVSAADSACTSPQTLSNIQFDSPAAIVFQIYDTPSCNSVLTANPSIFSNTTPLSIDLENNYDLCYAKVDNPSALGVSSGSQYYYSQPIQKTYYFSLGPNNPPTAELSASSPVNKLLVPAIQANSTSGSLSLILVSSKPINVSDFSFSLLQYVNVSSQVNIYFNSLDSCERSFTVTPSSPYPSFDSPCQSNVSNVTIEVISNPVNGKSPSLQYQVNFSAVPILNISSGIPTLSQQCSNIVPAVSSGYIANGTITCEPIICGTTSFPLADSNQDPFLGLYSGSFTSVELTSGVSSIQFINAHPEQLISSPIIK